MAPPALPSQVASATAQFNGRRAGLEADAQLLEAEERALLEAEAAAGAAREAAEAARRAAGEREQGARKEVRAVLSKRWLGNGGGAAQPVYPGRVPTL
jgi:hypothetical protein